MLISRKAGGIITCLTLLVCGCVGKMSYPTIEPISFKPSGMSPNGAVDVDSLTPTFKWKRPPEDVMQPMDLAVWYVGKDGTPGELFYSEAAFLGSEHTMKTPLVPGLEYFWSVKRHDSTVWATASYVGVSPIGAAWQKGLPFKIKAPAK